MLQGTDQEGQVAKHFEGVSVNYIECINVDYKSEREEAFQDLQLNVKGCADVTASFDAYCEPEVMDGANQYLAEGHGLQVLLEAMQSSDYIPAMQGRAAL